MLEQIRRGYLHIVRRVIAPFEAMRAHLGLDEEGLRIALANIQRCLHDLNNVAYFADLADAYIRQREEMTMFL